MTTFDYCLLALTLVVCLFLLVCAVHEARKCGEIWLDCPGTHLDTRVCPSCYLLCEETKGKILYFSFCDCPTGKTLQSSTFANCSLVEK